MELRSLSVTRRLLILGGAAFVAACSLGAAALSTVGQFRGLETAMARQSTAQMLVRELDTRASELKVDGYKASVRPDPAEEKAELADDSQKITTRLDALKALDLGENPPKEVAALEPAFAAYIKGIGAYVDAAIADQRTARADWENIQKANDATDEAVGAAIEALDERGKGLAAEQVAAQRRLVWTIWMIIVGAGVVLMALVKQLAQETARATEDISSRVQAIQDDSERASTAIGDFAGVIAKINEYQTTIAGAVEEQTATTREMNTGINDAATGSTRIAEGVTRIAAAASMTVAEIELTQASAMELSTLSDELLAGVSAFRFRAEPGQ
ncbi:MAG: methyl-accepting chemotaxis protein [Kineosporiaceae bacterium]